MNTIKKLLAVFFLSLFACGDHEVSSGNSNYSSSEISGLSSGLTPSSGSISVPTDNCNPKADPAIEFCWTDKKKYSLCGGKKYNPDEEFCSDQDNKVYTKCNGKRIDDTRVHFCFNNDIVEFCDGQRYDPDEEFCGANHDGNFMVYTKCNGQTYNIFEKFCFNHDLYDREEGINTKSVCGMVTYFTATHFCFENKVYEKCGNHKYNPVTEFCFTDKKFYEKCGVNWYDPVEEFCFEKEPYLRCEKTVASNGKTYNPLMQFCDENGLIDLCGGKSYKTSMQFCTGFRLEDKCYRGGVVDEYDPLTEICVKNKILSRLTSGSDIFITEQGEKHRLCGENETYNIDTHYCENNSILELCGGRQIPNRGSQFCLKDPDTQTETIKDLCRKYNGLDDFGRPLNSYSIYNYRQFCKDGAGVFPKCGDNEYEPNTDVCCQETRPYNPSIKGCHDDGTIYDLYDYCVPGDLATKYDRSKQFCYNGKPCDLCGDKTYNPDAEFCCHGMREDKRGTNFCYNEQLYPKCITPENPDGLYNPEQKGCFASNRLYNNCNFRNPADSNGTVGVCVDKTVLRCKQMVGDTSRPYTDYIIDPLPGMKCQDTTGIISGPYVDSDRNGEDYGIVQIGRQIWLRKNLNFPTCSGTNGCYYKWGEAICPAGFQPAADGDWSELIAYAGGDFVAGGRLKSTTGWTDSNDNKNGTDSYGFNAKPTAIQYDHGVAVRGTFWWASGPANYRNIISADTEVRSHHFLPTDSAFVRCVRYSAIQP
ncbi:MAG: hypothetical protein FWB90_07505 [Fibromonadales bacterium]|nr:hypothetical protein [Fibromonadales bacterium]